MIKNLFSCGLILLSLITFIGSSYSADSTLIRLSQKGSISVRGLVVTATTTDTSSTHSGDTTFSVKTPFYPGTSWGLYHRMITSQFADTLVIVGTPDENVNTGYVRIVLILDTTSLTMNEVQFDYSSQYFDQDDEYDEHDHFSISNIPYSIGQDGSLSAKFTDQTFFDHNFSYSGEFIHQHYFNGFTSKHQVVYKAPHDSTSFPTFELHLTNTPFSNVRSPLVENRGSAYPNPCDKILHLRVADSRLINPTVFDAIGRIRVVRYHLLGGEVALDVHLLEAGCYFVRSTGETNLRFIISR